MNGIKDFSVEELNDLDAAVLPDREALWGTTIEVGVVNSTVAVQALTLASGQFTVTSQHVLIVSLGGGLGLPD